MEIGSSVFVFPINSIHLINKEDCHATSKPDLVTFFTTLLLVVLLYGCNLPLGDSGGDQIHPPQTKILEVRVQPDTVAPADTASFTCVITDSLDKRFQFGWLINKGKVLGAEFIGGDYNEYISDVNNIKWIAPNSKGYYQFTVFANNGSKDSLSVQDGFSIVVR